MNHKDYSSKLLFNIGTPSNIHVATPKPKLEISEETLRETEPKADDPLNSHSSRPTPKLAFEQNFLANPRETTPMNIADPGEYLEAGCDSDDSVIDDNAMDEIRNIFGKTTSVSFKEDPKKPVTLFTKNSAKNLTDRFSDPPDSGNDKRMQGPIHNGGSVLKNNFLSSLGESNKSGQLKLPIQDNNKVKSNNVSTPNLTTIISKGNTVFLFF